VIKATFLETMRDKNLKLARWREWTRQCCIYQPNDNTKAMFVERPAWA